MHIHLVHGSLCSSAWQALRRSRVHTKKQKFDGRCVQWGDCPIYEENAAEAAPDAEAAGGFFWGLSEGFEKTREGCSSTFFKGRSEAGATHAIDQERKRQTRGRRKSEAKRQQLRAHTAHTDRLRVLLSRQ